MYRSIVIAIAAFIGFSATAQKTQTYKLNLGDFTELKVCDGLNVDYRQSNDSAGMVVYTTTDNVAPFITTQNKKGRLEVKITANKDVVIPKEFPTVKVYSRYLSRAENTADSTLRVLTATNAPTFTAKCSGTGKVVVRELDATDFDGILQVNGGTIVVRGRCTNASFSLNGTIDDVNGIQADELKAQNVKCSVKGKGSIVCWPESLLQVSGTGPGKVYYRGAPEIRRGTICMGIKVFPIEDSVKP